MNLGQPNDMSVVVWAVLHWNQRMMYPLSEATERICVRFGKIQAFETENGVLFQLALDAISAILGTCTPQSAEAQNWVNVSNAKRSPLDLRRTKHDRGSFIYAPL